MQFWFARGSEIPVRQQLVTQVVLGILCNDLAAGQRLASACPARGSWRAAFTSIPTP
jgi:hypothetical protein